MLSLRKCIIVIIVLILSTSCCFAMTITYNSDKYQPCYVATQITNETFHIDADGKATMNIGLTPTNTLINEVKATLMITNMKGINIYNKTFNMDWYSNYEKFKLNKTHKISTKGTYKFQVIYKCLNNDKLVETINSSYKIDTY